MEGQFDPAVLARIDELILESNLTAKKKLQAVITLDFKDIPNLNAKRRQAGSGWYVTSKDVAVTRGKGNASALKFLSDYRLWNNTDFPTFNGPVSLEVVVYFPDNRRRDILNLDLKAILDGFSDAQIWLDDKQIERVTFVKAGIDKNSPRVIFRISELIKKAA